MFGWEITNDIHGDIPWEAGGTVTLLMGAVPSLKLFIFHDFQLHEGSALFLHALRSFRSETGLSYKQSSVQAVFFLNFFLVLQIDLEINPV